MKERIYSIPLTDALKENCGCILCTLEKQLEEYAVNLGADVPFFIKGGTQRAEGIGEILTKLEDMDFGYFIFAFVFDYRANIIIFAG